MERETERDRKLEIEEERKKEIERKQRYQDRGRMHSLLGAQAHGLSLNLKERRMEKERHHHTISYH